jgi:hypothetical protein
MSKDRLLLRRDDSLDQRKRQFRDLNNYINGHGGWLISIPGDLKMRFEALPGSALPDQLRALGWRVERTGESERILPCAVSQKFTTRADGELVPFTEGSSAPVSVQVTHAGIVTVERYEALR